MRKLVTAVLALVIVGIAGYFGARVWAQQRVEREVESSFAPMRASGGNVSHGPVEIELLRREVKLSDIVAETPGAAGTALRIGRVVATGIGQPAAGRVSATRLEIEDLAYDGTLPFAAGVHVAWKIPRLVFEGYSGPTVLPSSPGGTVSALDAIRTALQQFTAVRADRVSIPAMTVSLGLSGPPPFSAEYGYSGIVLRDVADGRVGASVVDKMVAAVTAPAAAGGPGGFTTEVDGIETLDADVAPLLAVLTGSADDQYRRAYRKVSSGAYTIAFDSPQGPVRVTIEGFAGEDVALKPAKVPLQRIIDWFGSLPRAGEPVDPQRALEIFDMAATYYEAVRLGGFELRGMKLSVPGQQDLRVGAFRMAGFEDGRVTEMALEGLDGRTPQNEPVKVGRFALRGLGLSELMRSMAGLVTAGREPSPDKLLPLLHVLEGVEVKDLTAPAGASGKTVEVDTARISWGDFVDAFPTRVDAALRVTGPVRREDGELFGKLADAGMTTATIAAEAGLRWSETGGVAVLQPFTVSVPRVGAVEVKAAVGNVPRSALTLDAAAFMAAIAAAEVGPVEYSVKDLGVLDLMVADVARTQNLSVDEARRRMTENATQPAAALVPLDPDLSGVADAVAQFLEAPGGKLTVTVTPKGHVGLLPLVAMAKENAAGVLGQFRIESNVSR